LIRDVSRGVVERARDQAAIWMIRSNHGGREAGQERLHVEGEDRPLTGLRLV
jgi:hypothetical protein